MGVESATSSSSSSSKTSSSSSSSSSSSKSSNSSQSSSSRSTSESSPSTSSKANNSKAEGNKNAAAKQTPAQELRFRSSFQPSASAKPQLVNLDNLGTFLDPTPMLQQKPTLQAPRNATLEDLKPVLQSTPMGPAASFEKPKPVEFVKDGRTFTPSNGYPVYAQGSGMPWAKDKMGKSNDTLSGYGCVVSAVAMGVSGITGKTITPGDMNKFMSDIGGFTRNGLVQKWDQMGKVDGSNVQVTRQPSGQFNADQIDAELAKGRPVVVQVDYKTKSKVSGYDGSGDHWILITGRNADGQYMANDSIGGRAITLHRNADGKLVSDEPPPNYTEPYVTTGNAATFDRGAKSPLAGINTFEKVPHAPIPAPAPDRAKLALQLPHFENGMLQPGTPVEAAIAGAADTVGVDYGYMKAMGHQESKFDPWAKAPTTTASGVYQFLDQTWLETVKKHGATHGLGEMANQISWDSAKKKYVVADDTVRQEILDKRFDPAANARMAAEYTQDNQNYLVRTLGIDPGPTELYMAHFLGAGGAKKFLSEQAEGNGGQSAASYFPTQAEANYNIFYEKGTGRARTLDEVYTLLEAKIAPNAEAYEAARGD